MTTAPMRTFCILIIIVTLALVSSQAVLRRLSKMRLRTDALIRSGQAQEDGTGPRICDGLPPPEEPRAAVCVAGGR